MAGQTRPLGGCGPTERQKTESGNIRTIVIRSLLIETALKDLG